MALVATIRREPPVEMHEWRRYVASSTVLKPAQPKEWLNPFTKKREMKQPAEGEAAIVTKGGAIGVIEPSADFEADGTLLVWAANSPPDTTTREVVTLIATGLNAQLEWV